MKASCLSPGGIIYLRMRRRGVSVAPNTWRGTVPLYSMGNQSSGTKEEFLAQGIHYHRKRWKLYNKEIKAAMARKEKGKLVQHTDDNQNTYVSGVQYMNGDVTATKTTPQSNGDLHGSLGNGVVVNGDFRDIDGVRVTVGGTTTTIPTLQKECQRTTQADRDLDPFWYRSSDHIENIVMSGGGSKGYSFIGSLKALEDCGVLSRLRRVAGSSVGGICAGLLAIGCSPQEIADIFSVDNRWLFQDQSCAAIYCVPNIMKKFGVHPADRFYRIYGGHIARKTGSPDITFKQLYEQTGRELCIVVTNLNKMCAEYCHPKTTPDMPIRLAVRMTMSFPVLYQPVQCEVNGVTSWYTDGGILDQFPIHVFDGGMLDMNHNASTPTDSESEFNSKTLGLYVVGETALDYQIWRSLFGYEIPYHPSYVPNTKLTRTKLKHELDTNDTSQKLSPLQKQTAMVASLESVFEWPGCSRQVNIEKFGDYLGATIEALLVQQRKLLVSPRDVYRTVPVNAGYVGTNDYVLEAGDREFMIRQGYECVRRFLIEYSEDANASHGKQGRVSQNGVPSGVVRHIEKNQNCAHRPVSIETQV